jgi:hypothetical protein
MTGSLVAAARPRAVRGGRRLLWRLGCLILLVFAPTAASQVVIASESIAEEAISRAALRAIFSMRLERLSQERLTVFVLPQDHPTHIDFSKEVLGVFPYQLQAAWNRAIFAGTGSGPIRVDSEEQMLRRVAETRGAIGYIAAPRVHPGLRVLTIEEEGQ